MIYNPKMPRIRRIDYEGAWHHVFNRGVNRKKIFGESRDFSLFLTMVKKASEKYGMELHCYCLMDNHYHLLVRSVEGGISQFMQGLGTNYSRYINKKYDRVGHLFGGRFGSRLVEEDVYLINLVRYIHQNPLKAGMVSNMNDYQWSSYSQYLGNKGMYPALKKEVVMDHFESMQSFVTFNGGKLSPKMQEEIWTSKYILGSPKFKEYINRLFG